MAQNTKPLNWLENNRELAYALIRFFVGIALFVRGWIFLTNPDAIMEMAKDQSLYMWFSYITFAHLIGGLLLMVGLLSRFASIIQLPVLVGAVFVVNIGEKLGSINQSLELAVLVLVLLVIFSLFGSGFYSLDGYIARKGGKKNNNTVASEAT